MKKNLLAILAAAWVLAQPAVLSQTAPINVRNITASTTLLATSPPFTTIDCTNGSVNIVLEPALSTYEGTAVLRAFKLINATNAATLTAATGDTIDGASSVSLTILNQVVILLQDGTHTWRLISNSTISPSSPVGSGLTNTTMTTVAGSAGHLYWIQPSQVGAKKVVIVLVGYTAAGTTAITFAAAFTNTPAVSSNSTGLSTPTVSTTTATIPISTTANGVITIDGI